MNETSFIRRKKQTVNFTTLPNSIFKQKMSLKAVGLLCYLLHLPEDWQIIKKDLHNRFKDGRDSTTNAFNELMAKGYITETEIRDKGKFKGKNFFVFDEPQNEPLTENPLMDKPSTINPSTENQHLLNTNYNKKIIEKEIEELDEKSKSGDLEIFKRRGLFPKCEKKENPQPPIAPLLIYPFFTKEFQLVWEQFKGIRLKRSKIFPDVAQKLNLEKIAELSGNRSNVAVKIVEQTIERGWQGFFPVNLGVPDNKPVKQSEGYIACKNYNPYL